MSIPCARRRDLWDVKENGLPATAAAMRCIYTSGLKQCYVSEENVAP